MNPDAMENEMRSPDMMRLKNALGDLARERERSDFACDCSWTRIQSCLREGSPAPQFHFWRWAAIGSCAVLLALVTLGRPGSDDAPFAESRNPQIWASGFHSARAQADVVWATGYDYLPASYPVK